MIRTTCDATWRLSEAIYNLVSLTLEFVIRLKQTGSFKRLSQVQILERVGEKSEKKYKLNPLMIEKGILSHYKSVVA